MGLIIKPTVIAGDKGNETVQGLFDSGASASFLRSHHITLITRNTMQSMQVIVPTCNSQEEIKILDLAHSSSALITVCVSVVACWVLHGTRNNMERGCCGGWQLQYLPDTV